jgi:hypothetical protein
MKSWATGDGRRATGDGRRATGDGRRATGDGRRTTDDGRRTTERSVVFAARSATALYRLLDVLPVFAGDHRVRRTFTLVPGSDFDHEALAAVEKAGARTVPWSEASQRAHDLILAASPKGHLGILRGPRALLPHGAGFGKAISGEGAPQVASGLDPAYLLPDGVAPASLYALAHPSQIARLARLDSEAASRAVVVGDPTLERVLASRSHRDRYRAALGTGARSLIVLTSTWGPESLLRRRPTLPLDLVSRLPHDAYQLALVLHPNEHSRLGSFEVAERLAPAREAGMLLSAPFEEWAALLVASDAVVTDHGSAALYAAALDRPVIAAYDGGTELIPGTPMAELLARSPRLGSPDTLQAALGAHRPAVARTIARLAFAEEGNALERLRTELYRLLELSPLSGPAGTRPFPPPAPPSGPPAVFAVRIRVEGTAVHVERLPPHSDSPAHHLASEYGAASERQARSSALIYRRPAATPLAPLQAAWTVEGWTDRVLEDYPGCRTAAVILSSTACVLRTRSGLLAALELEPLRENERVVYADPAAALSAAHAWLSADSSLPAGLTCAVGGRGFAVRLRAATAEETARPI